MVKILSEILVPKENSDTELVVRRLYFENNSFVQKGDELIDLETSKTAIILEAPIDGYIQYHVSSNDKVKINQLLIRVLDRPFDKKIDPLVDSQDEELNSKQLISNKAKKYIDEHDIDITDIDIPFISLKYLENLYNNVINDEIQRENNNQEHSLSNSKKPTLETTQEEIKFSKKIEIEALSFAQGSNIVSSVSAFVDSDLSKEKNGFSLVKNLHLPKIVYHLARLLTKHPYLNSYFLDNKVHKYSDINIGIAIDIDDGLKVYTIRNADTLSIEEIQGMIEEGVYKYLRKDLSVKDITESTFTITDLSKYGVSHFTPLVNSFQSGILGISSLDAKLNRYSLTLSFDHRVTEGKDASQFISSLVSKIKQE